MGKFQALVAPKRKKIFAIFFSGCRDLIGLLKKLAKTILAFFLATLVTFLAKSQKWLMGTFGNYIICSRNAIKKLVFPTD